MAQHEKKPLNWELVETLEKGDVRAEITVARLANGKKLYSTGFRRIIRDRETGDDTGKTTGFFKGAEDFRNIKALCDEVTYWLDADREEEYQNKKNQHGRRPHQGGRFA